MSAARKAAEDRVHASLDEGTLAVEEFYDAETRGHDTESAETRCRLALARLMSDVRALLAEAPEAGAGPRCPFCESRQIERDPREDTWECRTCIRAWKESPAPSPARDEVREAALTRDDAMTLIGHAEYLRRVHGEEDMPRFFDGLARRLLAALDARGERGE